MGRTKGARDKKPRKSRTIMGKIKQKIRSEIQKNPGKGKRPASAGVRG